MLDSVERVARSARAPRGAGARQPRSAHPLRHPQRLPRRRRPRRCRTTPRFWPRRAPASRRSTPSTATAAPTASSCSTACANGTSSEGLWMGWERKRGKIEEFNRLLRGATDTSFAVHGRRPGDPAAGPLLHHARQRHAPAARRRARADRHHHASAQPRRVRSARSAASPKATASCSRAISVTFTSAAGSLFARLYSGPHRRRPVHDRGLGHLSGPVRRRHLHRQGPLRRRRVHRRARGLACRRTRCCRTTCSRGCTRASRSSRTSSWSTNTRRAC